MTTSSLSTNSTASDSVQAMIVKGGPSVGVSLATIAGYSVSDLILWATLVYTILMIAHKLFAIWKDVSAAAKAKWKARKDVSKRNS